MSRLGYVGEVFNTTDGDGGFFDDLINDAQGKVNNLINGATTDIANKLNISDFYSVHIMNFCEGEFTPNGTAAVNGTKVGKNITECSSTTAAFHFNITEIIQDALPDKINLTDIDWPQEITDAQNAIRAASIAAVALYAIAIGFAGLAVIGAVMVFLTNGRISACCNLLVDIIGFIAIGAASAVSTVVIIKAVNALNKYGNDIGVSAKKGNTFLGMTWAATGLMFVAMVVSLVQLFRGRKDKGYITEMRQKK